MKENQASSTAFTVVQGILHTARNPATRGLVPEDQAEACEHILSATDEGRKRLKQLDNKLIGLLVPTIEKMVMPGITLHYVLRKRFIEQAVIQALEAGATQVVNLGAGFDTLASRLHRRYPEATFIEIDHPATAEVKQVSVGEIGENFHLLAVDLAEKSVEAVLNSCSAFDTTRKTVYVCEGVLMYLSEDAVSALFSALKSLTGVGSTFVFTVVAPMGSPNNNFGLLLRMYLSIKSEPLNWSLERSDLNAFVQRQGYGLAEDADDADLLSRYVKTPFFKAIHQGEYLAVAVAE